MILYNRIKFRINLHHYRVINRKIKKINNLIPINRLEKLFLISTIQPKIIQIILLDSPIIIKSILEKNKEMNQHFEM